MIKDGDRELFEERMRSIAENTAGAYGAKASFQWFPGCPAVYNDEKMAEESSRIAKEEGFLTVSEESSMGGDDFSFYEEKAPGCYIKMGTGVGPSIHQPLFCVNMAVLLPAVKYLTAIMSREQ